MKEKELKSLKKGAIYKVQWSSQLKTLKGHESDKVVKESQGYGRFGLKYSNLKSVIESGKEVQPMTWGEYEKESEGMVKIYNGVEYAVIYTMPNNPRLKTTSRYFYNGVEVDKQYLIDNGICSESVVNKKSSTPIAVFTPRLETVKILSGK